VAILLENSSFMHGLHNEDEFIVTEAIEKVVPAGVAGPIVIAPGVPHLINNLFGLLSLGQGSISFTVSVNILLSS
jgi:hypothetical protein